MNDRDPYSLVYDEVWRMLEASPEFCRLVPVRNRVKFSGDNADPIKREVLSADLPEVRVMARVGDDRPQGSSSSVFKQINYEIQISTGDQRFDSRVFPLVWVIDIAATQWCAAARWRELAWHEHAFVIHAIQRGQFAFSTTEQIDQLRNVVGWSTVKTIEVAMSFPQSLLKGI